MKNAAASFENDSAGTAPFYYPKPASVRGRTLAALLRGNRLTQGDALRRFGTSRLAGAIEHLRRNNWPVVTDEIVVPTSDADRVAYIARYHLPRTAIVQAGEYGSRYAERGRRIEEARRG